MIDFASTRPGTDTQAAACARLLTAVIAMAINDASAPFFVEEKKQDRNISIDAIESLRFLFAERSVFPLYAAMIGSSAEAIRAALLAPSESRFIGNSAFSDTSRRILQHRHRMWLARGSANQPIELQENEDD